MTRQRKILLNSIITANQIREVAINIEDNKTEAQMTYKITDLEDEFLATYGNDSYYEELPRFKNFAEYQQNYEDYRSGLFR